jgi:hypothetical protein
MICEVLCFYFWVRQNDAVCNLAPMEVRRARHCRGYFRHFKNLSDHSCVLGGLIFCFCIFKKKKRLKAQKREREGRWIEGSELPLLPNKKCRRISSKNKKSRSTSLGAAFLKPIQVWIYIFCWPMAALSAGAGGPPIIPADIMAPIISNAPQRSVALPSLFKTIMSMPVAV